MPTVAVSRDPIPLCTVMSELHIETFRALTMIMASFGQIAPVSGHDHESPIRGHFLKFLPLGPNRQGAIGRVQTGQCTIGAFCLE